MKILTKTNENSNKSGPIFKFNRAPHHRMSQQMISGGIMRTAVAAKVGKIDHMAKELKYI